eukprot:TRINITY_DN19402_c0_g1_i1.p1 TRINITY_DN19402_c0_g1~~TRINITY_DN19402_c0_g1_i1.p1  ORF type:complete len:576 (+),score=68.91 TRINITY_DN19402_c0_g1_i1:89-1729(+)
MRPLSPAPAQGGGRYGGRCPSPLPAGGPSAVHGPCSGAVSPQASPCGRGPPSNRLNLDYGVPGLARQGSGSQFGGGGSAAGSLPGSPSRPRYSAHGAGSFNQTSGGTDWSLASQPPPFPQGAQQQQHHQQQPQSQPHGAQRWQEAYLELEQEKRRAQNEVRAADEEIASMREEIKRLREQIDGEQTRRNERVAEVSREVEELERENKQLSMRLIKVQMQDSAKQTDVATVKKDVVARTMELEKILREFQQNHQDKLFTRLWTVTAAMQGTCQRPGVTVQIQTPRGTDDDLSPGGQPSMSPASPVLTTGAQAGTGPGANATGDGNGGTFLDPEIQQALKRRLQSLGDVVVYSNEKYEACCASGRVIPPGALRVRPRRCDHVFLVECLMPYWAEGLCPCCRCSFAYDRPQDPVVDESDRYSSVSTSISQLPRPMYQSSANSDGGSLRVPRARGRSASLPRQRRRSPSHRGGGDGRSEAASMRGPGRLASLSPPRSVASLRSSRSLRSIRSSLKGDRDRERAGGERSVHGGEAGSSPTPLPVQSGNRPL